jgi:hypothetical protein
MDWKHGEKGPTCFCGKPTAVMIDNKTGDISLVCLFHSSVAGALFPLPKAGRPDKWPEMTDPEMIVLVDQGYEEQDAKEGIFHEIKVDDQIIAPDKKNLN